MAKIMYENGRDEKAVKLVVRIIVGAALLTTLLMMFVIKPSGAGSLINLEFLWDAVHPFHWLWDSVATLAFIFVCLFVTGFINPLYKLIQPGPNSTGPAPWIVIVCAALMLLFFV